MRLHTKLYFRRTGGLPNTGRNDIPINIPLQIFPKESPYRCFAQGIGMFVDKRIYWNSKGYEKLEKIRDASF